MLKKTIVKLKTSKNLKQRILQPNADFKSSKHVAIVYSDLFETEENISKLVEELKAEGKKTSVLVFCHNPKQIKTGLPHFTSKDVSMTGEISNKSLSTFLKTEYDFALCLDESNHFLIDYIFSLLKAKCRVGFMHPTRDKLFEMMVHAEQGETERSGEVLRYLKMIQNI